MKKTHMTVVGILTVLLATIAAFAATRNLPDSLRVVVSLPPEQRTSTLRLLPLGPEVSIDEALAKLGPGIDAVQFYLPTPIDPCNTATDCAVRVQQLCERLWGAAVQVNFGGLCTGSCSSGHQLSAGSCPIGQGVEERFNNGSIEKSIEAARGKAQTTGIPVAAESSAGGCASSAAKSCTSTGGLEWFSFRQNACVYKCAEGASTVAFHGK